MVIRFSYAALWPRPNSGGTMPDPDDFATIATHVTQLANVLNNHSDVVLAVQLGFLGFWGELHYWDPVSEAK